MLFLQPPVEMPPVESFRDAPMMMAAVVTASPLEKRNQHFPLLAKGVNIEGWYAGHGFQANANHVRSYMTHQDVQQIKSLGFTHVRLPIDPDFLMDRSTASKLNLSNVSLLNSSVALLRSQGLAVVVDMHPEDAVKRQLATDNTYLQDFAVFWMSLAKHLSQQSSDQIFFEVLNEPKFHEFAKNPVKRWQDVQNYLVKAIRKGAPNNTIILTSHRWDNVTDITTTGVPEDKNTVYTIHYYEPMAFTHQGADWISPAFAGLKQMPYPYSQARFNPLLPKLPAASKATALEYQKLQFTQSSMQKEFASVVIWAKQHNQKLYISEFGVFKPKASPADRSRWIQDIRLLATQNGMGWSFWEYNHGFALMNQQGKQRVADPLMLKSLGLSK